MFNEQTIIPWGNVIVFFVLAIAFFYWAVAAQNYPQHIQSKLPRFMLNKKIMFFLGLASGAIAILKIF